MGSAGFILGGLLSGAGQGMVQEIADRRAVALQQLRGKQQAESDSRQATATAARDAQKATTDKELLALGSGLKIAETNAATAGDVVKIREKGAIDVKVTGLKIEGDKSIERLRGANAQALAQTNGQIDRAKVQLQEELDNGDVKSVQQTADGRFFVVRNDGSTLTTQKVGVIPKSGSGEDDPIASRRSGATPAAAATAAPAAPASPAAPAAPAAATPSPARAAAQPAAKSGKGVPVLSISEYQDAVNGAMAKVENREKGWRGLTQTQIRQKLEDIYSAAGYRLPSV